METSHVVPALIRKFLEAKERGDKEVVVWGTGAATREFLYSLDTAQAILDMRLQRLTGLERDKIIKDYNDIMKEIARLENILSSDEQITGIIRTECQEVLENFGDKNNVMYNVMFNHKNFGFLSKIGIVRELRVFYERFKEHQREFGEVYIHSVIQCTNIDQVERDFKDTNLFQTNSPNPLQYLMQ